jgi:hypothetical protein
MTLNMTTVPMSAKRITFKKSPNNGTIYVYYITRAYRNSKGRPTSDEVVIGKKDPESGMLIPNKKYLELFPETPPMPQKNESLHKIADYGNTYVLTKIAEETGLSQILKNCFPLKWADILSTAFYMLCEGNVMMYLGDYMQTQS